MKKALGHDNENKIEQNRSENSSGNEGDDESDEHWISVSQEDEDVGFPPESDDGGSAPDEKVKKGIKLFSCEVLNVCLLTANQIKLIPTGSFDFCVGKLRWPKFIIYQFCFRFCAIEKNRSHVTYLKGINVGRKLISQI